MSTPPALEQRRATVRQLHTAGHSNRAIARQLDISKDAVARDLRATEPPVIEPGDTATEPDPPRAAPPAATVARATTEPHRDPPPPPLLSSGNTAKPRLVCELDPRLIQDLNVLVDRATGRLPAPLERAITLAAAARRAAWGRKGSSHVSQGRAIASQGGV